MKEKLREHARQEYAKALKEMPKLTWSEFLEAGIQLAEENKFTASAETLKQILNESF